MTGLLAVVALDGQRNPVGRDRVLFTVPRFQDLQFDPQTPDVHIMPDGEHFVSELGSNLRLPRVTTWCSVGLKS